MRLALIIDKKLFPDGFTKIREGAEAMGGRLGLWCSPLSYYPSAVDPQRALDHGYESFEIPGTKTRLLSLAGEKYRNKYASSIAGLVKQFDLRQVKLDGLYPGGENYTTARDYTEKRPGNPARWFEVRGQNKSTSTSPAPKNCACSLTMPETTSWAIMPTGQRRAFCINRNPKIIVYSILAERSFKMARRLRSYQTEKSGAIGSGQDSAALAFGVRNILPGWID